MKPLEEGSCFLLDLEGHKVVTLRLQSKVAKEISGQDLAGPSGFFAKLKAKLKPNPESDRWLVVTNVDKPLLDRTGDLKTLIAGKLTDATGAAVTDSGLALCASVPVNGKEQAPEVPEDEVGIPNKPSNT